MRARRILLTLSVVTPLTVMACGAERDMPERMEMPDSMPVMRAMESDSAMDAMLDTMPGGEMARGDSVAAARLLKEKMQGG